MIKKNFIKALIIFIALLSMSCNDSEGNKANVPEHIEYKVKANDSFVIHGIDVKRMMNSRFIDIEKEVGVKTKIDDETNAIYITLERDFKKKQIPTKTKYGNYVIDSIDQIAIELYTPLTRSVRDNYLNFKPNAIFISGIFDCKENPNNKILILNELQNVLPKGDSINNIIQIIKDKFIYGSYQENASLQINFIIDGMPIAFFNIQFLKNKLLYHYEFSKLKEPAW